MGPQFIIITAAMSLGGMASIGFNHHEQVEQQVIQYHDDQEETAQRVAVAEVGARVEDAIMGVEKSLLSKIEQDREKMQEQMMGMQSRMQAQVEILESKQSSHDVLMERMSEDYTSLEFKWETLAQGFRPLPSLGSRFVPVKAARDAHPLLPSVRKEKGSWKNNY